MDLFAVKVLDVAANENIEQQLCNSQRACLYQRIIPKSVPNVRWNDPDHVLHIHGATTKLMMEFVPISRVLMLQIHQHELHRR